jgi:hypothetical protein
MDWGLTAAFHDLNNDGFPDLYVCNDYWTPDRIWINDGKGHFKAIAKTAIRHTPSSSMGVDFADIDRDGHVDIFALDMLSRDARLRKRQMLAEFPTPSSLGDVDQRVQVLRNTLLHNRGDNTFEEIADFSGVSASDWSWTPIFVDVDLDGYEDILIPTGHIKDVQDLDANERIMALQHPWPATNAFVLFQGKMMPFQEAFTTERMLNSRLYPRLETPIVAYHNLGSLRFDEQTESWGLNTPGIHNSIAMADLDGDGDLDLVANNLNAVAGVYRNDAPAPRVVVRLRGLAPNTQGIGARIRLLGGAVPMQSQEVISGGRYASGSESLLVFAAGKATGGMTIEVDWRSGRHSRVSDVGPNRIYEIFETHGQEIIDSGSPTNQKPEVKNIPGPGLNLALPDLRRHPASIPPPNAYPQSAIRNRPLFVDVSDLIAHKHHESEFNDFDRQPLLHKRLSQAGPGIAWFDVDDDGEDDLIIASGKGGSLAIYRNDGPGGFQPFNEPAFNAPAVCDQTTVLGWRHPDGSAVVMAGSANYEDGLRTGSCVRQYLLRQRRIDDSFPGRESSTGPLALGDIDGDGDLELFVGGHVIPGRYPEPANSCLFRYDGAAWQIDVENSPRLEKTGLVNAALWTDLNGDGMPELVLACEWGPIRLFKNEAGKLVSWDAPLVWTPSSLLPQPSTLNELTGWWTGVASGDFDTDGRLDIVVGNWGLNSPYHAAPDQPLQLYYGDWANRGTLDLLETEYDPVARAVVPRRGLNAALIAVPTLRDHFPTHQAFSECSVDELLRRFSGPATQLKANTLSSMLFLNRGIQFVAVPLPLQAQLAPVFAVTVADFNGDSHEDVFLSQNFFATRFDLPRLDAGRGLLLLGDGCGILEPVAGQISGIRIYGEQRGAAAADFDKDGRVDLAVAQNGAATKLLRNTGARLGLRVRLAGPAGNPAGIGAKLRLRFGQRQGPAREIHAGSGYWSQDSSIQVLGSPERATQLWAQWPGGKTTLTDLPPDVREITVVPDGTIRDARR